MLEALRRIPDVLDVQLQDSHLTIHLRESIDTARLVSTLVSGGAQVEEVRRGAANLEDAFLALMEDTAEPENNPAGI
jgi:hypothetical protein